MYLRDAIAKKTMAAAPVCSLVNLHNPTGPGATFERGDVPPLLEGHISEEAVMPHITAGDVSIHWSENEESVIVSLFGRPVACIDGGSKTARSRIVLQKGSYGHPWMALDELDGDDQSRTRSEVDA